jgi:disulfide bond formation protein DsbB
MPYAALAILAASLGALVGAALFQKFFDAQPCILCIFQRGPYAAALVLSILALLFRRKEKVVKAVLCLCALAFLTNVGIAAYHSGIERHWWAATNSCDVSPLNIDPAEMSTADLLVTAIGECDDIKFEILGLTLANMNVLICLGLAVLSFAAAFGCVRTEGNGR